MANTQAMCTSFMRELMGAQHNFTATNPARTVNTIDNFRAALYLASATVNAAKTTYGGTVGSVADTGEVTGTNYTPGGISVPNATAPNSTNTTATAGVAYWTPSGPLVYTTVTLATAFDAVLIFNSSQGNKAVSVHIFGSQTITSGTFTLTMPSDTTTTALLRLQTT